MSELTGLRRVGAESVDGVSTTKYTATVEYDGDTTQTGLLDLQLDWWVDSGGRLKRKSTTHLAYNSKVEITFSDFGRVNNIAIPGGIPAETPKVEATPTSTAEPTVPPTANPAATPTPTAKPASATATPEPTVAPTPEPAATPTPTPESAATPAALPPLTAPANVRAVSNAPGELTVTWQGADNATSYVIFAYDLVVSDASYDLWLEDGAARAATFTGLPAGQYQVYVIAQQESGGSYRDTNAASNTVTVAASQ